MSNAYYSQVPDKNKKLIFHTDLGSQYTYNWALGREQENYKNGGTFWERRMKILCNINFKEGDNHG